MFSSLIEDYYRPQRSCGQGYVFTLAVILSTGGSASVHAGDTTPTAKETPLPRRPPCQGDPPPRRPPCQGDTPCQGDPPPRRPPTKETPYQGDPPLLRRPPLPRRPPCPPCQGDSPAKETPPPPGSRFRHTVNERSVRILLECILVL